LQLTLRDLEGPVTVGAKDLSPLQFRLLASQTHTSQSFGISNQDAARRAYSSGTRPTLRAAP